MKKSLFFILHLLAIQVFAQQHQITVKIDGNTDSTMILANYWGDKVRRTETAKAVEPGVFVFEGDKKLPGGIYMLIDQNNDKLFEFVINENQKFTLSTAPYHYTANMKVKGSKENKLFFKYLLFNESVYKAIISLNDSLNNLDPGSKKYQRLSDEKDSLQKVLENYKKDFIRKNEGTFVAKLLKSMEETPIPETVKNNPDSTMAYRYLKSHYWDNFDLKDSRLLRTPLYSKKVKNYFDRLVVLDVDSVIFEIDKIIALASPNQETVSYLVWYFTSKYQNPKYMGFDKVFVHLVDKYFSQTDIDYTTPSILESLQKRADKLRPLLIGKEAPNLILMDTTGEYRSFLSIPDDFTILLFWDAHCGVCKAEIKKLKKVLAENNKYDVAVFAVNTNRNLEEWKKVIKERGMDHWINVNGTRSVTPDFHEIYDIDSTPVIYVLDKNKVIIAKKISAENIIKYLDFYTAESSAND